MHDISAIYLLTSRRGQRGTSERQRSRPSAASVASGQDPRLRLRLRIGDCHPPELAKGLPRQSTGDACPTRVRPSPSRTCTTLLPAVSRTSRKCTTLLRLRRYQLGVPPGIGEVLTSCHVITRRALICRRPAAPTATGAVRAHAWGTCDARRRRTAAYHTPH